MLSYAYLLIWLYWCEFLNDTINYRCMLYSKNIKNIPCNQFMEKIRIVFWKTNLSIDLKKINCTDDRDSREYSDPLQMQQDQEQVIPGLSGSVVLKISFYLGVATRRQGCLFATGSELHLTPPVSMFVSCHGEQFAMWQVSDVPF